MLTVGLKSGLCSDFSTGAAQIWETGDGVRCSKAKCVTHGSEETLNQRAIYAKQEKIQMYPNGRSEMQKMMSNIWSANLRIEAPHGPWTMGPIGERRDK